VVDVMDTTLTNHEVFTQRHAHDAKVASAQTHKDQSHPLLITYTNLWLRCCFSLQDLK
jgi:hypothetical protein